MTIRILFALLGAGSSVVHAQPGGGMMGGISPSAGYMQMFQTMGGTATMGSGMSVGMTDDLAVAPDGTAYVIRAVPTTQSTSLAPAWAWRYELTAISPGDGHALWKLPIAGGRISRPVLAEDGLIYLAVDNYQMFYTNFLSGGFMMTSSQAQANDGKLLIVSQTNAGAAVMLSIQTQSDVLSAPRIVSDSSGGYLIYIIGYDMMSWTGSPGSAVTFAPGEKILYAYRPDGSLKFSIKLSQAGSSEP